MLEARHEIILIDLTVYVFEAKVGLMIGLYFETLSSSEYPFVQTLGSHLIIICVDLFF